MEKSDRQRPVRGHGAPSDTSFLLRSVHPAVRQCILALPQRRYFARRRWRNSGATAKQHCQQGGRGANVERATIAQRAGRRAIQSRRRQPGVYVIPREGCARTVNYTTTACIIAFASTVSRINNCICKVLVPVHLLSLSLPPGQHPFRPPSYSRAVLWYQAPYW